MRQSETTKKHKNYPSSAHLFSKGESRTSINYWRNRIERTVSSSGKQNVHFSVRIAYKGRRIRFPLETANRNEGASKAASIFKYLVDNGWEKTIAEFKHKDSFQPQQKGVTVGDVINTVTKYSTVRPQTLKAYIQAFRKIVADIEEVSEDGKYCTLGSNGNKIWRQVVDEVQLAKISPVRVQGWRQQKISQTGMNASAKRHATVTANSQIRNAKALFSKKLLPFLTEELDLPETLPFDEVQAEKTGSLRYHSRIDAKRLITDADIELRGEFPEVYKIFHLALVCGLRVSEIDHLLWDAIDVDKMTLHIRNSEYHMLKSEDSEGIIDLSASSCDYFEECLETATGQFVVEVPDELRAAKSAPYRTQKHLVVLRKWLRLKGVRAQKPIHTLRKEVGSLIASEQGIYAASRYLRHADIQVTASFYADKKTRVVPSFT